MADRNSAALGPEPVAQSEAGSGLDPGTGTAERREGLGQAGLNGEAPEPGWGDFWLRIARWLLPVLLLVGVHEVGSKMAGQKLAEADRPKAAANFSELERGTRVRWQLAAQPAREGNGAKAEPGEAAGPVDEDGEEVDVGTEDAGDGEAEGGEADLSRPKPVAGVLFGVDFVYNRPLHCLVLLAAAAVAIAWLVRVHPLWALPVLVYTCSKVQEFYPVTHWPMYSNPSLKSSWYCYLADGEGEALPVRVLCGETAPKLKKRLRSLTEDLLDREEFEHLKDRDQLPASAWEDCAQIVLAELAGRSAEIGKAAELPPELQLVRVDIVQEGGTFVETPRVLGEWATGVGAAEGDAGAETTGNAEARAAVEREGGAEQSAIAEVPPLPTAPAGAGEVWEVVEGTEGGLDGSSQPADAEDNAPEGGEQDPGAQGPGILPEGGGVTTGSEVRAEDGSETQPAWVDPPISPASPGSSVSPSSPASPEIAPTSSGPAAIAQPARSR